MLPSGPPGRDPNVPKPSHHLRVLPLFKLLSPLLLLAAPPRQGWGQGIFIGGVVFKLVKVGK